MEKRSVGEVMSEGQQLTLEWLELKRKEVVGGMSAEEQKRLLHLDGYLVGLVGEAQALGVGVPNIPAPEAVDNEYSDFDETGYDEDGYDINGYDEEGYDRSGYDEDGYDRDGYDEDGLDGWGNPRESDEEQLDDAPVQEDEAPKADERKSGLGFFRW